MGAAKNHLRMRYPYFRVYHQIDYITPDSTLLMSLYISVFSSEGPAPPLAFEALPVTIGDSDRSRSRILYPFLRQIAYYICL